MLLHNLYSVLPSALITTNCTPSVWHFMLGARSVSSSPDCVFRRTPPINFAFFSALHFFLSNVVHFVICNLIFFISHESSHIKRSAHGADETSGLLRANDGYERRNWAGKTSLKGGLCWTQIYRGAICCSLCTCHPNMTQCNLLFYRSSTTCAWEFFLLYFRHRHRSSGLCTMRTLWYPSRNKNIIIRGLTVGNVRTIT